MDYKYAYKKTQKELNELGLMIDLDYIPEAFHISLYPFRPLTREQLLYLEEKNIKKK